MTNNSLKFTTLPELTKDIKEKIIFADCGCKDNQMERLSFRFGEIYIRPCVRCYREIKAYVLEDVIVRSLKINHETSTRNDSTQ